MNDFNELVTTEETASINNQRQILSMIAEGVSPMVIGNRLGLSNQETVVQIKQAMNSLKAMSLYDLLDEAKLNNIRFKNFMDEELNKRKPGEDMPASKLKFFLDMFRSYNKQITDLVTTSSDMQDKAQKMQYRALMNEVSNAFTEAVRDEPNSEEITRKFMFALERNHRNAEK